MTGSPGGRAAFSLGSIKNVPLREVSAGRYNTDYTIRKGDDVAKAAVSVQMVTSDGQTLCSSRNALSPSIQASPSLR